VQVVDLDVGVGVQQGPGRPAAPFQVAAGVVGVLPGLRTGTMKVWGSQGAPRAAARWTAAYGI
jgi:hypothetical protein